MKKFFYTLTLLLLGLSTLQAQEDSSKGDNLLAEKPIYTLGKAKTWTAGDESYTFITEDLQKLVAVPTNTANVFLYPENGTLNTEENRALGPQGFYIDLGSSQSVGTVFTTWEGAAANSYEIYLTDDEPTIEILKTTPTYSASKLGQYTENTAILPEGSKGRYLVFQVTDATNWGWGIKIRSIAAYAPTNDVLTTFKVFPTIIANYQQTPITMTILNQFGIEMGEDLVDVEVSDNAIYSDGCLTIVSGTSATFTAKTDSETLTATVYSAQAPSVPAASQIKTPIYTNTVTSDNLTAVFTTDWNGGATPGGELNFDNGVIAQLFTNTRCVFFSNSVTTGAWNGNINPAENGYKTLNLDVFSGSNSDCTIEFESVENLEGGHTYPFTLKAGEWNPIVVNVAGATKLGNLSIRFTEDNAADILLANIYFTPVLEESTGEVTLSEITATEITDSSVTLTLSATTTDTSATGITYNITDGVNSYETTGTSGESINYTITGLNFSTTYNFTITASDGKNVSEPQTISITTLGNIPAPETPSINLNNNGDNVASIYSTGYGMTEQVFFKPDNNSTARMSYLVIGSSTTSGSEDIEEGEFAISPQAEGSPSILYFTGFDVNNGGSIINIDLDVTGADEFWVDIFSTTSGSVDLYGVWEYGELSYTSPEPYTLEIKEGNENTWQRFNATAAQMGYGHVFGNYNPLTTINKIELKNSTLESFALDNLYFASSNNGALAVEAIGAEAADMVSVFNLQGICVKSNIKADEALKGLPEGVYIVGGKKVLVRN